MVKSVIMSIITINNLLVEAFWEICESIMRESTEEERIEIIAYNLHFNEKNKQYLTIKLRIFVSFL